jgi:hypothetical protein
MLSPGNAYDAETNNHQPTHGWVADFDLVRGFFDAIRSPVGKLLKGLGPSRSEIAFSSWIRETAETTQPL